MSEIALTIAIEQRPIGFLTVRNGEAVVSYSFEYRQDFSATPLSVSMPQTTETHRGLVPDAWLWGLLPDNKEVLRRWASDYSAMLSSPASFLATDIGLDCAGAVQFYPGDLNGTIERDSDVLWLTEEGVAERLRDLREDATSWLGRTNSGQFSLAGAQSKTALRWNSDTGLWGVPHGDEPSTHIFKPAVPGFIDQDINEHLCLAAATRVGFGSTPSCCASLLRGSTDIYGFNTDRFFRSTCWPPIITVSILL